MKENVLARRKSILFIMLAAYCRGRMSLNLSNHHSGVLGTVPVLALTVLCLGNISVPRDDWSRCFYWVSSCSVSFSFKINVLVKSKIIQVIIIQATHTSMVKEAVHDSFPSNKTDRKWCSGQK